jgi:hypothetical protein
MTIANECFGASAPVVSCAAAILTMGLLWVFAPDAQGWGGEHHSITQGAIEALPAEEQEYLAPEKPALVKTYCGFPDMNWPCYGEWGGGTGDPKAARFPDTRREWEISFYCGWDPVVRKGKGYPHAPPESFEAVSVFFLKAADAFKAGRLEDGARFLGVMFHYIQDSGAFPHTQPIHRNFHVKDQRAIRIEGYAPVVLGATPQDAAKALAERVRRLTEWTEKRGGPMIEAAGMPLEEAKRLCAKETMPAAVVKVVEKLRAERPADFEAAALDCANECTRVCADAIHTALAFAQKPRVEPEPNPLDKNLVFNPSFEESNGDRVPDGWYVGWLDLLDRMGRAEWYRAGTHWEKHVRSGQYSVLTLWSPSKGLEWRQTWRRAIRVRPGEKYRGSVWAQASGATGANYLALEFCDTSCQPMTTVKSESLTSDAAWKQVSIEAKAPDAARWARVILHSEAYQGAVWFDDVEMTRIP